MTSCIPFFILSLILSTFSASRAIALKTEELVGGNAVDPALHKHHAAIIGKVDYSQTRLLIGNGAIIGDFYILVSYYSIFDENGNLKPVTFFALVGEIELSDKNPAKEYEIEKFIMAGLNEKPFVNSLVISKLKNSLELNSNRNLAKVAIPPVTAVIPDSLIVAGFGSRRYPPSNTNYFDYALPLNERNSPVYLTSAIAKITEDYDCKDGFDWDLDEAILYACGVIPSETHQHRGLCARDYGAPLVHDGNIFGFLREHRADCDDTEAGAVYVNVPLFGRFIRRVLGEPYEYESDSKCDPLIVLNNPHRYLENSSSRLARLTL